MSHAALKNRLEYPSGPGALQSFMPQRFSHPQQQNELKELFNFFGGGLQDFLAAFLLNRPIHLVLS